MAAVKGPSKVNRARQALTVEGRILQSASTAADVWLLRLASITSSHTSRCTLRDLELAQCTASDWSAVEL